MLYENDFTAEFADSQATESQCAGSTGAPMMKDAFSTPVKESTARLSLLGLVHGVAQRPEARSDDWKGPLLSVRRMSAQL
jgi:hypothetical protein